MVPESECKIPTLMVSPLLGAGALPVAAVVDVPLAGLASLDDCGFEQPVNIILPVTARATKDLPNARRLN